jgi:protein-S-isoprenylcysteine O-methyltransferase Ste14
LLTGAPLIIWYGVALVVRIPELKQQIVNADWSSLDVVTVSNLASRLVSLIFITALLALMVLRHTPRARTSGLLPRITAVAGTYLGVGIALLPPANLTPSLSFVAILLILFGFGFALFSVLNLGRSLSLLPEARRLVTRGPYALIRHPLYLGEAIALAGLTLQFLSPLALILFAAQCACQIARMVNEERVLASTFPEYEEYKASTARILPYIY